MRVAALTLGALSVALVAAFLWLRTSLPETDGTLQVAGIDRPVDILRDANGFAHIFAGTEDDAWFGVGFVHAQDRLWQMELMRLVGQGRLAEVLGKRALGSDEMMRTLGFYRLATEDYNHLVPPVQHALVAYAAGVNAYLAAHAGALPPEFVLLRHRPAPWRPADSLVWGRIMALRLSTNWYGEALRATLAARLTPAQLNTLWPGSGAKRAAADPPAARDVAELAQRLIDRFPATLAPLEASNVWAVDGSRSETGGPLLANDPHLGYSAPILWYLVQVSAPGLAVTGATAPGVPFVLLGHDARVAWGFTSAETDTEDLFVEKIDPTDPDRYLAPGGPRPFVTRRETIKVRDAKPVTLEVRATRHGPVVSSLAPGLAHSIVPPGHAIALAATALRPIDRTPEAIWRLDHTRRGADVAAALRLMDLPAQNVAYADADGHIGMVTAGLEPIRKSGDGLAPMPGWTGAYDWNGFVPFDALPHRLDPPSHRLVNANDAPAAHASPYFLGRYWGPAFRAQRIRHLLDAKSRQNVATMEAIQGDVVSDMARDLKPLMLTISPIDPRAREAVALLRGWDGTMDADRSEPLIFVAWLDALVRRIAADEMGPAFESWRGLHPRFVRRVLTRDTSWCDDVKTKPVETCHDQLDAALDDALAALRKIEGHDIADWRWGDRHMAQFRHVPFGYVPVLRRLFDVSVPIGGGDYTIDRAAMALAGPTPFAAVHGPGFRAVYDLADLERSRFVIATGQSGNPFSRHYDDLTDTWHRVAGFTIELGHDLLETTAAGRLRLVPRPPGG